MKKILILILVFVLGLMSVNAYNYSLNNNLFCNNTYFYQESSTIPNQTGIDGNCNLKYNGIFVNDDLGDDGIILINYTKPNATLNNVLWSVKHGVNTTNFNTINYSLPFSCINKSIVELKMVSSVHFIATPNYNYLFCKNTTNWIVLSNVSTNTVQGVGTTGGDINWINDSYWSCNNGTANVQNLGVNATATPNLVGC